MLGFYLFIYLFFAIVSNVTSVANICIVSNVTDANKKNYTTCNGKNDLYLELLAAQHRVRMYSRYCYS